MWLSGTASQRVRISTHNISIHDSHRLSRNELGAGAAVRQSGAGAGHSGARHGMLAYEALLTQL